MDKPTKDQVRDWMQARQRSRDQPPTIEEIRRQLGWDLVRQAREEQARRRK